AAAIVFPAVIVMGRMALAARNDLVALLDGKSAKRTGLAGVLFGRLSPYGPSCHQLDSFSASYGFSSSSRLRGPQPGGTSLRQVSLISPSSQVKIPSSPEWGSTTWATCD